MARRILLVDDDPDLRRATRAALEAEGYEVVEAKDGQAALDLLENESQRPNLILTDLIMPRLNGWELR
jgi:CheY-like chemotaxis protein